MFNQKFVEFSNMDNYDKLVTANDTVVGTIYTLDSHPVHVAISSPSKDVYKLTLSGSPINVMTSVPTLRKFKKINDTSYQISRKFTNNASILKSLVIELNNVA